MGRLSPDTFARSTPSRVRERKLQSHQRCDNVGRLAAGQSGRVNEEAPLFRARTGPVVKAACRVAYVSDRRTVAKQVVHTAFGAPKHVGACLASEPDLGGKQGVTPPTTTSRRVKQPPPSRRDETEATGLAGACASLVVHVLGKKGGCSSEASPSTPRARGLLNFPPPSSAQWPSGSRAHLWTLLRLNISFAEEGASDLCFAHKLPAYARAPFSLETCVCGSRRKHKRRGARLPDRRF